jgi:uncharacterized protein YndB with AHSA1/START domain
MSEELKIERKTLIQAPLPRVWKALTTAQEFGAWFSSDVKGEFEAGKRMELISTHATSKGQAFHFTIERMEPERVFSWRWHPGSAKPEDGTTLVEFQLEETEGGTLVTVTETGFEGIALARRVKAFDENTRGWESQLDALVKYAS